MSSDTEAGAARLDVAGESCGSWLPRHPGIVPYEKSHAKALDLLQAYGTKALRIYIARNYLELEKRLITGSILVCRWRRFAFDRELSLRRLYRHR